MSKIQLTISPDYVGSWTHVEAVRELFQNALDNQTINKENEMFFSYEDGVLQIGNKTSVLTPESLLLGTSSKRDDTSTIGHHGEGYKIAFMVLLRLGKPVTVYNYGSKEIWTTRLVKSRKFNGALLVEVDITKKAIFNTVPHHDLVIKVDNITEQEYQEITESNLHLHDSKEKYIADGLGEVLLDHEFRGKVFVNGLFISRNDNIRYGYNIAPKYISLDRDRKLVDSFSLAFNTSRIWRHTGQSELVSEMLMDDVFDVKFINEAVTFERSDESGISENLSRTASAMFLAEHGDNAVPVHSNYDLQRIAKSGANVKPVLVSEAASKLISKVVKVPETITLSAKKRLKVWFDSVSDKLSEEQVSDFESIYEDIIDY